MATTTPTNPRETLKALMATGAAPLKLKVGIRPTTKTFRVLDTGDLPAHFGPEIALLSIGVTVQALRRALPGWAVSAASELEEQWHELPDEWKVSRTTGDRLRDYRNIMAERLVDGNVYEYARHLQRVRNGEDSLAPMERLVPTLDHLPVTPKMDKTGWTHFMPSDTYEGAINAGTAIGAPPSAIVTYGGKFYYPRTG